MECWNDMPTALTEDEDEDEDEEGKHMSELVFFVGFTY